MSNTVSSVSGTQYLITNTQSLSPDSKILVTGGTGMVGSAIIRTLIEKGYTNIISTYHVKQPKTRYSAPVSFFKLDLRDQSDTLNFFETHKPEYVFFSAARVGGILANNTYKAEFIYDNMAIALNVINSAYRCKITKLLNLGSSCIYPKLAPQPLKEEYLLTGPLEPTNEPYAIAKIAAIKLCRYYNEQYGTNFISVMPTNLYGPDDNYNLETAHVLPALLRKLHLAKLLEEENFEAIVKNLQTYPIGFGLILPTNPSKEEILSILNKLGITFQLPSYISHLTSHVYITLWGSGSPYREFLHVDDAADGCVYLMENVDALDMRKICNDYFVNIGTGKDLTIKELSCKIKEIVGFKGEIVWDTTKPDGTPRKLLDVSRIKSLGWEPQIGLEEGIRRVYGELVNG
nr:GDP-L-fucose synthase [Thermodesulfovibrio thiophilus]